MKIIETGSIDPRYNLALEEYLFENLESQEDDLFLLWQNEPTIVVGRFQNTLEEVNSTFVKQNDIHVVRRISGGGAVYHDMGNLNYTFIVHTRKDHDFDFARYTAPIIEILKNLGVNAAFTSRNDLTIEGKKFSGNAQYMRKGKLLHHGTLLFESDLSVLAKALKTSSEKFVSKGIKSIRSRVTNIRPHLQKGMTIQEFKDSIIEHFPSTGVKLTRFELGEKELTDISLLAQQKYDSWDWNYGRSPEFSEKKSKRFEFGKVEVLLKVSDGRILNCKFYGDFFGNGDLGDIESRLKGTRYERTDLEKELEHVHLGHYFKGIPKEELLDLIVP